MKSHSVKHLAPHIEYELQNGASEVVVRFDRLYYLPLAKGYSEVAQKESAIARGIANYLDDLRRDGEPVWFFKVHGSAYQVAGIPDFHILYDGSAIYLEVKVEGKKPSPLQVAMMEKIALAGGVVDVVYSVDDVRVHIERIRNDGATGPKA